MADQNKVKKILDSDEFKGALGKVLIKFKLTDHNRIEILNIFENLFEGKLILFALSNELQKRLKIDFDKAVKITAELYDIYDRLVPSLIKKKVEQRIGIEMNLPDLPQVTPIEITVLNTNYKLGEKWLKDGRLPAFPELIYTSPDIISKKEIDKMLAGDPDLSLSQFIDDLGVLADRELKINKLEIKLKNKGVKANLALDLAKNLVSYVENNQKYLLAQKSLQRDILEGIGLVKIEAGQVVSFNVPEDIQKLKTLSEEMTEKDRESIKRTVFKVNSLLNAYQNRMSIKNASLNQSKLNQYANALNNIALRLEGKKIEFADRAQIEKILNTILSGIVSGSLLEMQLK